MEIQKQILLFFINLRTPFLNVFNQIVTYFGETVVVMFVCFFTFYCLDKKKGFSFIMTLFTADLLMNILKTIFVIPRPFMVDKGIKCLKESTATGYSFPSGHSTHAGVLFTSVAKHIGTGIAYCICMIMVFLVGISRLYLACHWPLDVIVGWTIGICFVLFLSDIFSKFFDCKELLLRVFPFTGIACLATCLTFAIAVDYFDADFRKFSDLTKNLALLGATLLVFDFEEKILNFKLPKQWSKRIVNLIGVLIGTLFFLGVLKKIVPNTLIWAAIRYGMVAVWGFGAWPFIACKVKLLEK